jgi:hypothetical protein
MVLSPKRGEKLYFGVFLSKMNDTITHIARILKQQKEAINVELEEEEPDELEEVAEDLSGNTNLWALFLPSGELLVQQFDVHFFYTIDQDYIPGQLCLFRNFVSFIAPELSFTIPLCNISFIIPASTMVLWQNAFNIITHSNSFFFTCSSRRDIIYDALSIILKEAKLRSDIDAHPAFLSRENEMQSNSSRNQMQIVLANEYLGKLAIERTVFIKKQPELKSLLQAGLPDQVRSVFWQMSSGSLYKRILEPETYEKLVLETRDIESIVTVEIQKDIRRSFPEHDLFQTEQGLQSLTNVLRAYAWRNPKVGYTQGMNLVCSHLLGFMV